MVKKFSSELQHLGDHQVAQAPLLGASSQPCMHIRLQATWDISHTLVLLSQEAMPQTSVVFSSILGPNCNRQVQPGMGERGGGASSGSKDLIFQDGRLTSGSLEALMEHLVPTVDYYPDVSGWDLRELEQQCN